ncbi:MAG: 2-dehydro-3-deoxy-D-gluconate 5-dehydrogenase KduD [Chthoniobacterales bacterium]|nr:2-dehydro-3-deoxy-D-gluconate 5-dehydrogenase KduD [Chthoniobacterales bacterium]
MGNILEQFQLGGKVAIVTGAGRGLGQGMAVALAEAGADIVAVHVSGADETRRRIEALGRRCVTCQCDLGEAGAAARITSETLASFGRIDILVNNAGIIRRADFLDFSEKDWDDVMNVNIKAVFLLSQAAARQMVAQNSGGKIINIASMLSFQGGIRVPSYTSSKSAVMGLTRLMACELGPKGIQCNAIAPGYMETDNTTALRADPVRNKAILERIPAGRWGNPGDLAGAVVFLASPASDYVNGFTLAVDGGWLAR